MKIVKKALLAQSVETTVKGKSNWGSHDLSTRFEFEFSLSKVCVKNGAPFYPFLLLLAKRT
jgi:hypothetical protein